MSIEEHRIRLNGLEINYAEAGQGQPMIFLHNGGGFWHSWEHQLHYFSKRYKVFGIDWPGFGESQSPDGLITLNLLTEVLNEFIERKTLEKVILVGNCIGGSAALNYTMRMPEKVHKLLVFNICPGNHIYRLSIVRKLLIALNHKRYFKGIFSRILVFGFTNTPIKRQFPKILFGTKADKTSPLFARYIAKYKLKNQTKSRVNMVYSVHTFNLSTYIDPHNVPEHLLVWGHENRVTSLENHGYDNFKILKSDELRIIKNAGHLCMYEKPTETNNIILNYLSGFD
jgi:pimeloyl-ACP methyl ester carboxylesterase